MDLQMVDPVLKDTPDAVVHRIQIRWSGQPHLWGWTVAFFSAATWQCNIILMCTMWFNWRQHYVTR